MVDESEGFGRERERERDVMQWMRGQRLKNRDVRRDEGRKEKRRILAMIQLHETLRDIRKKRRKKGGYEYRDVKFSRRRLFERRE